jgi:ketosteroid isomerase-like protein
MPINDVETEVFTFMNRVAQAYSRRDADAVLALAAPDIIGFGSGPDEKVVGAALMRKSLDRDFSQCDGLSMKFPWMAVRSEGNVAWVAADCTIAATIKNETHTYPGRATAVAKKTGDQWQLALLHIALPAADQAVGRSYPGTGEKTA